MIFNFGNARRLIWGFGVELALGALIFLCVLFFTEEAARAKFLRDTATDWLAVSGQVLFPAAVAIWITYVNIESSSFGDYLRYQKASQPFHLAFIYPAVVFFTTTLALIFAKGTAVTNLPAIAVFLLGYSSVVFVSMILNVTAVMRLYGAFRLIVERERQGQQGK